MELVNGGMSMEDIGRECKGDEQQGSEDSKIRRGTSSPILCLFKEVKLSSELSERSLRLFREQSGELEEGSSSLGDQDRSKSKEKILYAKTGFGE
jgi:hypothetical protein